MTNKKLKKLRLQWTLALLPPLALFLVMRAMYVSTPQYAFKAFQAAVRAGDAAKVKRLSTANFSNQKISLWELQEIETDIRLHAGEEVVWDKTRPTLASVDFDSCDQRSNYHYFLQKAKGGWRVDYLAIKTFTSNCPPGEG